MSEASGTEKMLEAALGYADDGCPVLPLHNVEEEENGALRCSCDKGANCDDPGKHPRLDGGFYRATTDHKIIREWWEIWPLANIGLPTGAETGIVVIDADGADGVKELEAKGYPKDAPRARTGGGGLHVYGKYPEDLTITSNAKELGDNIDVRAKVGYVVAPPSRTSKGRYEWEVPPNGHLPDPPEWVIDWYKNREASPPEERERLDTAGVLTGVPEGERDTKLYAMASKLRWAGVPYDSALRLVEEAAANCTPPFPLEVARQKVAGAYARYAPGGFNLTDMGNAERFVAMHGDRVRYCAEWGKWLIWTGARWELDRSKTVKRLAVETVRSIYAEAGDEGDSGKRKAIAEHAKKSESDSKIKAMLSQSEPFAPILPEELDGDSWLLNCTNGTVDLRTGALKPHDPHDYITKVCGTEYDPEATCPTWEAFLERILPTEALRKFVQRCVGYSLSGDVSEQGLFFLHGGGANGKSTLINIILEMMGGYAKQAAPELLSVKSGNNHPTELADLFGARLVASVEVEEGKRLAESLVKQMTGGDRIKARYMRQDFFEFEPTHKTFLVANHKPVIKGTDYAIWRRIKLVPFEVTIPEGEQDKRLPEKLKEELPGILAWAVRGCTEWQREGLGEPVEVTQATEGYRTEMDTLQAFFEERCFIEPGETVSAQRLYDEYKDWCLDNGEHYETQNRFGARLSERGFARHRRTTEPRKGSYEWHGIGLIGGGPGWRDHFAGKFDINKRGRDNVRGEPSGGEGSPPESGLDKPNTAIKHSNGEPSEPKTDINTKKSSSRGVIPEIGSLGSPLLTESQESPANSAKTGADEGSPDVREAPAQRPQPRRKARNVGLEGDD